MRINNISEQCRICFSALKRGDIFKSGSMYYIKIDNIGYTTNNCVNLSNGKTLSIDDSAMVIPIDAELNVDC